MLLLGCETATPGTIARTDSVPSSAGALKSCVKAAGLLPDGPRSMHWVLPLSGEHDTVRVPVSIRRLSPCSYRDFGGFWTIVIFSVLFPGDTESYFAVYVSFW